MNSQPITIFIG